MSRLRATLIGAVAVLLWSLLALLTVRSGTVPPFQLTAICLAIAATVGLVWGAAHGRALPRAPVRAWALGAAGIFGYHFFYFTALRNAPAAEASLVAYLWPLLIVLFSGLLPGERLTPAHALGALVAFAGAALVLSPAVGSGPAPGHAALGFASAVAGALTWSGYSVLNRRFPDTPTESVTGFCAVGAVLSALAHLATETTAWPADAGEWLAVLGLGLGPVGLAFFVWDLGTKRGDIQLLGTMAYAAPVLSTLALGLAGEATLTPALILAAALVAGG
ncbi:MAG: DMT family transporter, partial [Paracoccaceae bacterium]